jgi:hypothetical protein
VGKGQDGTEPRTNESVLGGFLPIPLNSPMKHSTQYLPKAWELRSSPPLPQDIQLKKSRADIANTDPSMSTPAPPTVLPRYISPEGCRENDNLLHCPATQRRKFSDERNLQSEKSSLRRAIAPSSRTRISLYNATSKPHFGKPVSREAVGKHWQRGAGAPPTVELVRLFGDLQRRVCVLGRTIEELSTRLPQN